MMSPPTAPLPLKRSFPPVIDENVRLLVVGSLPGEVSLAEARYYAHPRNQFWQLMAAVIGADLPSMRYEARLQALLGAGVGLWDTVGTATRSGSLDGDIRLHRTNDLSSLAATLPSLRAIGFNGGKSAALGVPQLRSRPDLTLVPLPSSSPAYTLSIAQKLEQWRALRTFLPTR